MIRARFTARAAVLLALLAGIVSNRAAHAQSGPPPFVPGRVLVKFQPGVTAAQARALLQGAGGQVVREITPIGVQIVQLPPQANPVAVARAFGQRREVAFAEPDYIHKLAMVPNDPYYSNEWHLSKIAAPTAWNSTTGSDTVTVAIVDTGVDGTHPDLAPKMVPGWNFYSNNSNTTDVTGHGTVVAGAAAACSNNGVGVASPAWGCRVMPVRVTDAGGGAFDSTLAQGIIWAADHGARVANCSFWMNDSATLTSAAQYFQAKGGVVVFAAGNGSAFLSTADNPYILTISATDANDALTTWTNTGNSIDLAAPGMAIYTTTRGGGYGSSSGTSLSAPIVSGAAALVISANPALTGAQVQEILKQSADDMGVAGWDTGYGWGRVNAARAVSLALGGGGTVDTTPPTVSFSSPVGGATVSGTVSVQVNASDSGGIASVSLEVDGTSLGSDTSPPYSFSWNTTSTANDTHTLTASATDAAGNLASRQIIVTVSNPVPDTTPPTVSISSPAMGQTVWGTVSVQVNGGDNVGLASVRVSVDGVSLGTDTSAPYSFPWDTMGWTAGTHSLTATAADAAGNTTSATIEVTVDNESDRTAPTIRITAPAAGARVSGAVSVSVSAADDVRVVRVELYVDGQLTSTATGAPFTTKWSTRKAGAGPHTLQCKAYDAAGNVGTSPAVTVYK